MSNSLNDNIWDTLMHVDEEDREIWENMLV